MILKSLCFLLIAFSTNAVFAQGSPFVQPNAPVQIASSEGTIAFEREHLDFAPQSTGVENCANISLLNSTDHPRLLTQLRATDPRHFYVVSPAEGMLPLTIGANTNFYINLCFKADDVRPYESQLLAIFQTDTVRLRLTGRGLEAPQVKPIPEKTEITSLKGKRHKWAIQFGLHTRGTIKLTLENMLGKVVRTFPFEEVKTPGYYEVLFDEKDDLGKKIEKGGYILRLEVTEQPSFQKVHSAKLLTIK
jgi:hypothetical protein